MQPGSRSRAEGSGPALDQKPDLKSYRAELLPGLALVPGVAALLVLYVGVDPDRLATWAVLVGFGLLAAAMRYARRVGDTAAALCLTLGLIPANRARLRPCRRWTGGQRHVSPTDRGRSEGPIGGPARFIRVGWLCGGTERVQQQHAPCQ